MISVAAVVILYYPNEKTGQFIQSYLSYVQKLFVMDNSEKISAIGETLKGFDKVVFIHDGENKGLSYRLNIACKMAVDDGFDFLLTMDQDSYFENQHIENYLKCLEAYNNKGRVAMFGVNYINESINSNTCAAEAINYLITSGSIVNLQAFLLTGGFDENLFIDEVDLEYCYNARSKGLEIVRFNNIFLHHSLGVMTTGISFKTFKRTPRRLHSPIRVYYMLRNYLYVKKKYPQLHKLDGDERRRGLFVRIKNNLIYGKKKLLLIRLLIKGYLDFKNNKMGKIAL
jgi:rhamnosyltransferase